MPITTSTSSRAPNFLNCAAPKHKIAQNCHLIRQIQNNYPPYPSHLGHYGQSSSANASPKRQQNYRPMHIEIPTIIAPDKLKKHPGILKKYKSCPVSPVHEELDWAAVHDRANQIKFNESTAAKRHTLYSDDAQTILDMIQSGTERLIAEITQKYGDLDDYEPKSIKTANVDESTSKFTAKKEKHEHGFLSEEENFSSDSLEDCSLDLDCENKEKAKKTCKKHHRKQAEMPPKRSVSEYFIYDDYYTRVDMNRKVSLSDILNDDSDKKNDQKFLETQRHSSASFFLGNYPIRKSQESILSDDCSGGAAGSFCNSMESILSDESECKSAPLEVLFERGKMGQRNIGHIDSKSYGSSPNSTNFDYYMQNCYSIQDEMKCDISNYGFDSLDGGARAFKVLSSTATRSPTHHRPISTSLSVPQFTDDSLECFSFDVDDDDFIPSLTSKVAQYNKNLNKSLCKDFTKQRVNPMAVEALPKPIIRTDVFSDAGMSSATIVMKKSCSFEIDMGNGQRKIIKNSKKFEQNLQRFEKDRRDQQEQRMRLPKSDYNLDHDYVPHKPPVAHRRASSMKGRGKPKIKEKLNTISSSQTTYALSSHQKHDATHRDFVNKDYLNRIRKARGDEKSFEVYIAEKGVNEDDNMDSLDSLKKCHDIERSMDSLDCKNVDGEEIDSKFSQFRFITTADLGKFRDIERKIDVINKLVELEERKLEQERIRRENRVKPLFDGNTKERGFVKHLTKNFDMLAKSSYDEVTSYPTSGMKRNFSLPDVLEGSMIKIFEFDDIDEPQKITSDYYEPSTSTAMKLYDFDDNFESAIDDDGEGVHHTHSLHFFCVAVTLIFTSRARERMIRCVKRNSRNFNARTQHKTALNV